ncbi:DEAD/DEAH box helicase family protein [Spiroplasma endosymbiont of Anurida maritima]|uniref:DEAD/DEAH box helicase n=1 Tax=Spiroplasma endosymbiont of Anurida maritima TaxID=2967972 RepID=UPI0036D27E07
MLEYSNSFIKDYTNVYAITATSNNLFKQEKNKELLAANIDSIDIAKMYFDVVIIDEASKLTPIEILMPIIFGKTTILVGDYRQLPPILPIRQEDVELINEIHGEDFNYSEFKKMFEESMFKNIISSANSTISGILLEQYRSNEDIMKIVNNFYNNKLKLGTKNQNFDLRHTISVKNQKGLTIFEPNKSIYWLDSSTDLHGKIVIEDRAYNSTSLSNVFEINLIKNSLLKIQESLKPTEKITIAIISFYKKQITALKHELNKINLKNIKLNISTVDDFQGKEADHVFVSLVRRPRDTSKMDASFIEKYERINVAFSRAKKMLVIVGALDFYKNLEIPMPDFNDPMKQTKVDVYKRIAKIINTYGIIHEAHNILEEN